MRKRIIIWGLGLSAIHLVLTLVTFCIAYNDTMTDFERDEPTPATKIEIAAHALTPILMQPLLSLWTPWMSRHVPVWLEHLLFLGNCLLWGFAAAFLGNVHRFRRRAGRQTA
jgi:hypothetical protein